MSLPTVIDNQWIKVPSLSTAERDALTPENRMIIYNSTAAVFQKYEGGAWVSLGAGASVFVDSSFSITGSADATKIIRFEVDGNTTGTTRVYTVPDYNGTLATLAGTETLANKTLTAPAINNPTTVGGTIDNAAVGATTPSAGKFTTLQATTSLLVAPSGSIDASAAAQVDSTTKGELPPRMTTTQRDAIAAPADGLRLYNTTRKRHTFRQNGRWQELLFARSTNGRLSLTSGLPVTTTDVTAATRIYFTPDSEGGLCGVRDSAGEWYPIEFPEVFIDATAVLTGTLANASAVVTGLSSTQGLVVGMKVTGVNVGASAVINSIDSSTQVTLSVNSTGGGAQTLTFKIPAGKMADVYVVGSGSSIALEYGTLWSSDTARAAAISINEGVMTKSSDLTRKYLGVIRTTAVDGQIEDSLLRRFVSNHYNQVERPIEWLDTTDSWNDTTNTWKAFNTSNANRAEFVQGVAKHNVSMSFLAHVSVAAATAYIGLGLDSTTVPNYFGRVGAAIVTPITIFYNGVPGVGYHYLQGLQKSSAATSTFYGDNAGDVKSVASGKVWA